MTAEFMRPITLTYADLGHARVAILRPAGVLDRSTYDGLIAQAWAARDAGAHYLIVDLCDVTQVGPAGLRGLHAVALIAPGASSPDPGVGWATIGAPAEDCCQMRLLPVVTPQPPVRQALAGAPFGDRLAIHADLEAALAALAA